MYPIDPRDALTLAAERARRLRVDAARRPSRAAAADCPLLALARRLAARRGRRRSVSPAAA